MTEEPRDRKDHKAIDSALLTIEEAQAVGLLHETLWSAAQELGVTPERLADALWHGLCDWDK